MGLTLYKEIILLGMTGVLLAGCSSGVAENPAQGSDQTSTSPSTETSNGESSTEASSVTESSAVTSNDSEIGTFVGDDLSELLMQPEHILLPTYFPNNETTAIDAQIITNEANNYGVVYTYERGTRQIGVSGRIYETEASALQNLEATTNDAVAIPDNEQEAHDLGNGITGYGETREEGYYFGWQEGNWTFTIQDLPEKESDVHAMAEAIVEYLQAHPLPVPTAKGTVYIDFTQAGSGPNVHILWNDGNRVYEMNTIQMPTDAFDIVLSME